MREAITVANVESGAERITFAPALTSGGPATISLLTALPDMASDMTIDGPGATLLTIQRSTAGGIPKFRIFTINSGTTVTLFGLTITNGRTADRIGSDNAGNGGGILNSGTLTLTFTTVTGNTTGGGGDFGRGGSGGGIYSDGTLTLNNSIISGNTTGNGTGSSPGGHGGGIYASTLTVNESTIAGNQTGNGSFNSQGGFGGGIFNSGPSTFTITNSVVSGNQTGKVSAGCRRRRRHRLRRNNHSDQ